MGKTPPVLSQIDLQEQKDGLVTYLLGRVKAQDWHAVQDAASDIREVEAKLSVLAVFTGHPLTLYSIDDDRLHPIKGVIAASIHGGEK